VSDLLAGLDPVVVRGALGREQGQAVLDALDELEVLRTQLAYQADAIRGLTAGGDGPRLAYIKSRYTFAAKSTMIGIRTDDLAWLIAEIERLYGVGAGSTGSPEDAK
jgi:hypothetical protein